MKMPSNQTTHYSQVPQSDMERSVFDLSYDHKTMFNPDYLIPFHVEWVLPGDSFNVDVTNFIRMASPLQVPVMDNMYLDTFFFFVPNRLLWSNFKKFFGEQASPADSISFTKPQVVADASTGFVVESLADYFGLPLGVNSLSVDAELFRCYNLIYQNWFRDENLQNTVAINLGDGPDAITDYTLLKRCKRPDYFTTSLPSPQKGTAVSMALTGNAPVTGIGKENQTATAVNQGSYETNLTHPTYPFAGETVGASASDNLKYKMSAASGGYPMIYADLSAVSAFTINDLRLAFQTQRYLERNARSGTRYQEFVRAHFHVTMPDMRVQIPEFLGGRSTPIQISAVQQTSATASQPTPAGALSAYVFGTNARDGFTKSFSEHGVVMGLCMVRADQSYSQGLNRHFTRSTRYDYYDPVFAHLGEQSVLSKEIYCDGAAGDANIWGYQERWSEYRTRPSKITGKLRPATAGGNTTPISVWHLSELFSSRPTLSATFKVSNTPITRIEAVTTQPAFVMDSFIKQKATRPMPTYSVPGLIDHF